MTLDEYKNIHTGDRLFILGNGPSLSETPLDSLSDEYTLAMNKIDKVFPGTNWRPTYYLNVLTSVEQNRTETMLDDGITCFYRDSLRPTISSTRPAADGVEFLDVVDLDTTEVRVDVAAEQDDISHVWSDDITETVYRQYSSIYTAAQIAHYTGFEKLYFLGCDLYPIFKPFPYMIFDSASDPHEYKHSHKEHRSKLDFLLTDGKPVRSLINGVSYALLRSSRVMHPLYSLYDRLGMTRDTHVGGGHYGWKVFKVGQNKKENRVHRALKTIGRKRGFETYNATLGGQLEVHERVDLADVLE